MLYIVKVITITNKSCTNKLTSYVQDKLWEIEDVLSIDPSGERALVKWVGWEGSDSWVELRSNPELRSFIHMNRANPASSTATRARLAGMAPQGVSSLHGDLLVIRGAMYDALGVATRKTPEGNTGHHKRVRVEVPFPVAAWERHFVPLFKLKGDSTFDAIVSVAILTSVLGRGWECRSFPTSTETYVSTSARVRVKWGFRWRPLYNHDECVR